MPSLKQLPESWLTRALSTIRHLPQAHRLGAVAAVLLCGLAVTFVAALISKEGPDFLQGAPVIALALFVIASVIVTSLLRNTHSAQLIGLFYFLPLLYTVIVISLALINRANTSTSVRNDGSAAQPMTTAPLVTIGSILQDLEKHAPDEQWGGYTTKNPDDFTKELIEQLDAKLQEVRDEQGIEDMRADPERNKPRVISVFSPIAVGTITSSQKAVEGAIFTLFDHTTETVLSSIRTGSDGQFEVQLKHVKGAYSILVSAEGHLTREIKRSRPDTLSLDIDL